MYVKIYIY